MKTYAFSTFVFGLIILLSGILGIQYTTNDMSYVPEIIAGVLIFSSSLFMLKNKMWPHYFVLVLSIGLFILFGFKFYKTTSFSTGVLAALSAFSFFVHFIKIVHLSDIE